MGMKVAAYKGFRQVIVIFYIFQREGLGWYDATMPGGRFPANNLALGPPPPGGGVRESGRGEAPPAAGQQTTSRPGEKI